MKSNWKDWQNVVWAAAGALILQLIPVMFVFLLVFCGKDRPNAELADAAIRFSHVSFIPFFFMLLWGLLCVLLGLLQSLAGHGFGNVKILPHFRALGVIISVFAVGLFFLGRAVSFPLAKFLHAKFYPQQLQY